MNTQILNFKKTDHFLLKQWDRKIEDKALYRILPFVECSNCEKDIVIVSPSFLETKDITNNNRQCLIIVIKTKILLTAYWCDHPNYLFTKEKDAHFQLLY